MKAGINASSFKNPNTCKASKTSYSSRKYENWKSPITHPK